jgi:hypothetical protein
MAGQEKNGKKSGNPESFSLPPNTCENDGDVIKVGDDRSGSKDRMEIIGQIAGDKGKKSDQDLFAGAGMFLKKKIYSWGLMRKHL